MKRPYKQLSNRVIVSDMNVYYSKTDGADSFRTLDSDNLDVHFLCAYNIEIENEELELERAVEMDFKRDSDGKCIGIVISDSLGTFIGDWY